MYFLNMRLFQVKEGVTGGAAGSFDGVRGG